MEINKFVRKNNFLYFKMIPEESKLDGVGPFDNRPLFDMWYMTHDM